MGAGDVIQEESKIVFSHIDDSAPKIKFTAEVAIKAGAEVYVSGSNSVSPVVDTQYPVGVALNDAAIGEDVNVMCAALCRQLVINTAAGTLAAGALVRQNATLGPDGIYYNVVVPQTSQYASLLLLEDAVQNVPTWALHLQSRTKV